MVELIGEDKFFWASDFPHPDHTGEYIKEVEELAEKLTPPARRKVLGENVMRLHHLTARALTRSLDLSFSSPEKSRRQAWLFC